MSNFHNVIPSLFPLQDPGRLTSDIASDTNAGPQLVIWGTDVVVSHCKEKFRRFIERYMEQDVEQDEQFDGMDINEPLYIQKLEEVGAAIVEWNVVYFT